MWVSRHFLLRWAAASALASAVLSALGAAAAYEWVRPACYWDSSVCEGARIAGVPLGADLDLDAWLGDKAHELSSRTVEVTVQGVADLRKTLTLGELGAVLDVARTASLAHSIGHRGDHLDRFVEARRASEGKIEVPLIVNVDEEAALLVLAPIKDATDEFPVPARLDLAKGGIISELPGHFLDLDRALEQIRAAAISGADKIELERVDLVPRVSREYLERIDHGEELSHFTTWFSRKGDQENRARNIDTAAARLDGVVLLPHELFSFNELVGPRTVENGFSKGWEIFKGEMVEGIGGGTCQVASTFHAAAFLAGLDIIERLPHSRPSAYITMGLDATVVYPVVDLKIRNPYDFPVVVHSHVEGGSVEFELRGHEQPAKVVFGRQVLAVRPFTRKVEEMPGLPSNRIIRKQHGIRGYKILRTRTIAYRDGTAHSESNVDVYPPTVEMYLVAPGTDVDAVLPPLADPGDGSGAGWAPPEAPPSAPPPAAATGNAGEPVAAATTTCTVDCPQEKPKIVEAPGVHAPRAEQLRAAPRVIIGSGKAR
jgi:vancomycin resistance protein YoaR